MVQKVGNEDFQDMGKILEILQAESHRGGVLLGAALLDEYLGKLLAGFMVEDTARVKMLLDDGPNAPLGAFSARTLGAFCLGLISEDEFDDITQIRKIRNVFAHRLLDASFDDEKIKAHCNNLKTPETMPHSDAMPAPDRFIIAVSMVASRIAIRALQVHQQQRDKAKPFVHQQHVMITNSSEVDTDDESSSKGV